VYRRGVSLPVLAYENRILHGDCLVYLRLIPDYTFHSVVCDPPYGLGTREPTGDDIIRYLTGEALDTGGDFMGTEWEIPSIHVWKECFRVLRPGGYILAFAGTRTWDIMSVGLRAAGFENRDTVASLFGPTSTLMWLHGQGFPKSLNIAKKIDDHFGAVRERVGRKDELGIIHSMGNAAATRGTAWQTKALQNPDADYNFLTKSTTEEAKKWDGWGTALKPAWEPVLCFRKPMTEETIAANIARYETGGMNIDASRVKHASPEDFAKHKAMVDAIKSRGGSMANSWKNSSDLSGANDVKEGGRWPANAVMTHADGCKKVGTQKVDAPVINRFNDGMKPFGGGAGHEYTSVQTGDAEGKEEVAVYECVEGCPVLALDAQSGVLKSVLLAPQHDGGGLERRGPGGFRQGTTGVQKEYGGDSGGASRFFAQFEPEAPFYYSAKASRAERNAVLLRNQPKVKTKDRKKVVFYRLKEGVENEEIVLLLQEILGEDYDPETTSIEGTILERTLPASLLENFEIDNEMGGNDHPTVKPLALMKFLVRLVTPKGGIVLDPYCGSGTTCLAATEEGMMYTGIEKDEHFHEIAHKRVDEERERGDQKRTQESMLTEAESEIPEPL
jgi:DNA modification methylase